MNSHSPAPHLQGGSSARGAFTHRARRARGTAGAATTYDGFYLRNNLGCNGAVPSSGPYNLCPDIIQSATAIDDPQTTLSTPASWATAYDTAPAPGVASYCYVRGLDGAAAEASAQVSLYYAPAQLILFPSTWQNNKLSTTTGQPSVSVSAASSAIGVGGQAFLWTPATPADGAFYALVARAVSTGNPDTIPTIQSWLDMSTLLTQELGFGFSNVSYVEPHATSWYQTLGLSLPLSLPSSGQVLITVSSTGFSGGTVGLVGDRFTSRQAPILLNPTALGPNQVNGITVTLEPGFSTTLTVEYWAGSGAPPAAGSVITVEATYVIPASETGAAVSAGLVDGVRNRYLQESLGISPQATAILGSASFVVAAS